MRGERIGLLFYPPRDQLADCRIIGCERIEGQLLVQFGRRVFLECILVPREFGVEASEILAPQLGPNRKFVGGEGQGEPHQGRRFGRRRLRR